MTESVCELVSQSDLQDDKLASQLKNIKERKEMDKAMGLDQLADDFRQRQTCEIV